MRTLPLGGTGRKPLGAPMRALAVETEDGVALGVEVSPNPAAAVRLVVSHGNGLAAHGYRAFWQPLCEAYEVVLFDMRGHGRSSHGDLKRHTWTQFTRDWRSLAKALALQLDRRITVGVLHSLSAVSALMAVRDGGLACDALVLYDPSLPPPSGHPLEAAQEREMTRLAESALRRRRSFADPTQLAEQFMRRERFGVWRLGAPLDMARATLARDGDDGSWTLSCGPEREASIFSHNTGHVLWPVLRDPPCPTHLVGGDPKLAGAGVPSRASHAAHIECGVSYEAITGTGHFLQLEAPEACRQALGRFLAAIEA